MKENKYTLVYKYIRLGFIAKKRKKEKIYQNACVSKMYTLVSEGVTISNKE